MVVKNSSYQSVVDRIKSRFGIIWYVFTIQFTPIFNVDFHKKNELGKPHTPQPR